LNESTYGMRDNSHREGSLPVKHGHQAILHLQICAKLLCSESTINKRKRIKVRAHVRMKVERESVRGHSERAYLRAPIVASIFWAAQYQGKNSEFVRLWDGKINRGKTV
jgi:hypothetical protein